VKALRILSLLVFIGLVYLGGDLIANNAAFTNDPGALARLKVYFTLNRSWTDGGYPLPEVASRIFYGDPQKLRTNIDHAIGAFSGWRVKSRAEDRIVVRVAPSFWHRGSTVEIGLLPVPGGLRMEISAVSDSSSADLGADRNYILNLYHAIGEENAIHPPV